MTLQKLTRYSLDKLLTKPPSLHKITVSKMKGVILPFELF